ncbi:MAG: hypothetical protein H2B05_00315 [Nitrosopumilaceae archaeon]|uniref:Uncharacterized protein n=2 Tax=Candidatus Nitrosomaritimum aestuariumsis TaxID=3342354 RepID=A0AC60W0X6_9ARCH|nr:hypothetical protein [Nitrosopumilaceae archaeon]MBA4453372.1 hypothetical protein [Nitrosopumilaceae archaeon]
MTFLKPNRISKDLDFIKNISGKIDKKISQSDSSNLKIENLTLEELQDLRKIVGLADFMLHKYEDKKDTKSILEYFVSIIRDSAESIESIDDEVSELIISAEDSIGKIKELHSNISEKYDLEKSHIPTQENESENSANNFTKIAIEINSHEYLENSTDKEGQVI